MQAFSEFVEGHVTGVVVNDREKTAEIALRSNTKGQFIIRLQGVERLLVDELREQNIINNIRLWNSSDTVPDYHGVVACLVSGKDDDTWAEQFASAIQEVERYIANGEQVLLTIEPVYGATIVALARTCSLEPARIGST